MANLYVARATGYLGLRRGRAIIWGMSPTSHQFGGNLGSWPDIKQRQPWDALLVGNGFSQHIWKGFAYDSIFEEAQQLRALSELDQRLFQQFATSNFERVLFALAIAIQVEDPLEQPVGHLLERYRSIQDALAETVRSVHVPWVEVATETLKRIRAAMRGVRYLFTTSYDLLFYWAAAEGPRPFDEIADYFWTAGAYGNCEFNPARIEVFHDHWTRLIFLHGALHLVELPSGETVKRTANGQTLLDQFGQPFAGDDQARPLVISEGDAVEKARAIQENAYLTFAASRLRQGTEPLVVFGHRLSDQDLHLVHALNERGSPIAVSLLGANRNEIKKRKLEIAARLAEVDELHFFDAETHPLGQRDLRVPTFKIWRLAKQAPWFGRRAR